MTDKLPHISNPLDEVTRRIQSAHHHVYRAGYQDTAYELKRALDKLDESRRLIEDIQAKYPIAHPDRIDTSLPPTHPSLMPEERE